MGASRPPTLAELEREHILKTLSAFGGNRTKAAHALAISLRSLHGKLALYAQAGHEVVHARRASSAK
jgi:DNA-binding NtrC family response regulator